LIAPEWKERKVKADLAEIEQVRGFLWEMLDGISLAEEESLKLELALHEVFVNIVMHAYPDANANNDILIRFRNDDDVICMEIRDRGIPFNPENMPPFDLEKKIQSGTQGGFGIYLSKTLTDEYSYKREGDENVIAIRKRIR
jgi:anti-sigma regulatory factor (Ser/Thr protein kinase)